MQYKNGNSLYYLYIYELTLLYIWGDTVTSIIVFEFPPRESFKIWVNGESLNPGFCPLDKYETAVVNADNDELIAIASFFLSGSGFFPKAFVVCSLLH